MLSSVQQRSIRELKTLAEKHEACLVSFSAGKDSLCVLDMAVKSFKRVEAFFLYFLPGLEIIEAQLDYAKKRWGIEIRQYPNHILFDGLKRSTYLPPSAFTDSLPDFKRPDIYNLARKEAGIDLIITGSKKCDFAARRYTLAKEERMKNICDPIRDWHKLEVLAYLKFNKIPLPPAAQNMTGFGIDLSAQSLLWLYDNSPADFAKIEAVFPFIRALLKRRELYGDFFVKKKTNRGDRKGLARGGE